CATRSARTARRCRWRSCSPPRRTTRAARRRSARLERLHSDTPFGRAGFPHAPPPRAASSSRLVALPVEYPRALRRRCGPLWRMRNPVIEDNITVTAPDALGGEARDAARVDGEPAGMARATGLLALGNITSRVLGLIRETIISALFGAGAAVDALNLALVVPRGLYDLLIGGHVNSALVPVLSDYALRKDRDALWDL